MRLVRTDFSDLTACYNGDEDARDSAETSLVCIKGGEPDLTSQIRAQGRTRFQCCSIIIKKAGLPLPAPTTLGLSLEYATCFFNLISRNLHCHHDMVFYFPSAVDENFDVVSYILGPVISDQF